MSHVTKSILILGGTGDARRLARAIHDRHGNALRLISSLAGRTPTAPELPGETRIGGFGGAEGLATYLTDHNIDAVIDATHPFAPQISAHAHTACNATDTPRLMLIRPPWDFPEDAPITHVADMKAAARLLPALGRRVFLTTGGKDIDAFSGLDDVWFLVRRIAATEPPPLARHDVIIGHPPFSVSDEQALITQHAIECLVTKNSGGDATWSKIEAAMAAGINIIVVDRPDAIPGEHIENIDDAVEWVSARL